MKKSKIIIEFALIVFIIIYSLCFAQTPELIPYRIGAKMGFINKNKELIIKPIYDEVQPFNNGIAVVKIFDKYGLIDKNDDIVIPFKYNNIQDFIYDLAKVKKNEKYGVINIRGEEIVPCEYDCYYNDEIQIYENVIFVRDDSLKMFALFEHNGNQITDFEFQDLKYFNNTLIYYKNSETDTIYASMNSKGEPTTTDDISFCGNFSEGVASAQQNNKYGYINSEGKFVIPAIYQNAADFQNGYAVVKKDDKYGIINIKGKEIIPIIYDYIHPFSEGYTSAVLNGKYGFLDKQANITIPFIYESASPFKEDLAVILVDGNYRYINTKGNIVIPHTYDMAGTFSEGFARVKSDGHYGFINTSGKPITQFIYDRVFPFSQGGAAVEKDGKWGFINKDGEYHIKPKYDYGPMYEKFLKVNENPFENGPVYVAVGIGSDKKITFVNSDYKEICPLKFDNALCGFNNGLAKVELNSISFYIDEDGNEYYEEYIPEEETIVLSEITLKNTELLKLRSDVIDEEYSLFVSLPPDYYKTNKTYPAIFLLDADYQFGIVVESMFMMGFAQEVPECIIVGISYNQTFDDWYAKRIRDMCPTERLDYKAYPGGGGAQEFMEFIENDVFHLIETNYRISENERTIVGYSLGGLFGTYVLFKNPELFNRYVLISPSLWWDEEIAMTYEQEFADANNVLDIKLFLSYGEMDSWGVKNGTIKLIDTLKERNYKYLDMKLEILRGQTHFSTFPAAFVDGIKAVYKYFNVN